MTEPEGKHAQAMSETPELESHAIAQPAMEHSEPATEGAELRDDADDAGEYVGPADPLSPAVRRLVRQYDLDVAAINGTGPGGRVRVGDVMAVLGARAQSLPHSARDARPSEGPADRSADVAGTLASRSAPPAPAARAFPSTTVFECDLRKVIVHNERHTGVMLASYWLLACEDALSAVPEICAARPLTFGVTLYPAGSAARTVLVGTGGGGAPGTIDGRLLAFDAQLRAADADRDPSTAGLLVHDHGSSGSLIAAPTPLGATGCASLGVGRVRRQVVMDGGGARNAARVAALCYATLSFDASALGLDRANLFLDRLTRVLEDWPL